MIIVEFNSGLGNQICQYIFSRWLEIVGKKQNIFYDDQYFYISKQHNGFELNLFPNIKLNMIKYKFDIDVWKNMLELYIQSRYLKKLPNILLENGLDIALVADGYWHDNNNNFNLGYTYDGTYYMVLDHHIQDPNNQLNQAISQHENVYYMGLWFSDFFGNAVKKEIEHELKFPELKHESNIAYRDLIISSDISIGLHIRKGDFITVNKDIPSDKYSKSVKDLKRELNKTNKPKPSFYIFSDNIEWCKENKSQIGFTDSDNITFIEGNDVDERNYLDMQLMTYCDYLIHNKKSSFAFAAQMISEKPIIRLTC